MATQRAHVNPELLKWARETMRMSVEDAEKKIGLSEGRIAEWEDASSEIEPTVIQLRKACSVYKRPMAAFYLPKPPSTFRVPHDYRRLPGENEPTLSPEFLAEFRAARYRRSIALEVAEKGEIPVTIERLVATVRTSHDVTKLAPKVRKNLREAMPHRNWKDSYDAFNSWREAIENLGVLVSHFSRVAVEEVRGFAITETPLPLIGLNGADSPNARIFTLLHEFAHILLGKPGVSNLKEYPKVVSADQKVERWCNALSAEVLVPRKAFLKQIVDLNASSEWNDEDISELANEFFVSREVILGRLLTLGHMTQENYWDKMQAYRRAAIAAVAEKKKEKSSGGPPVHRRIVRSVGKPFARIVVGAYDRRAITPSDLAEYLGMRLKHLGNVRAALSLSTVGSSESSE